MAHSMSPSQMLHQGISSLDPVLIEQALDMGANPYEKAIEGSQAGQTALEMFVNHPHIEKFTPAIWNGVARCFDTPPKTAEDTHVLQSCILNASKNDARATLVAHQHKPLLPKAHAQRQMLTVSERSGAWYAFKSTMSFPENFSLQQSKFQQDGRLEGELSLMELQGIGGQAKPLSLDQAPHSAFKPSFSVGKENHHHQLPDRDPSLASTTKSPSAEQHFINQFDNSAEEIGDYHSSVPQMSAQRLKDHLRKTPHLGQAPSENQVKNKTTV